MRYDESAVIGVLGGGYGEPPVRVADLEEAARQAAARRAAARDPSPAAEPAPAAEPTHSGNRTPAPTDPA